MIKAIVTDIEGTTSSLSFVHDVLFPYAREHIADFVRCHAEDPSVVSLLNDIRLTSGEDLTLDGIIHQLIQWIETDQKITPLKELQGMIWEGGYQHGDFTGHIYADAVRKLQQWHKAGIRLYVFSSGSVQAQKLLFGYSDAGDLTPLFSDYFDTRIGNKKEKEAYLAIARQINVASNEILFLSDIRQELDAAAKAGMQTVWLVRDGALNEEAIHPQAQNFDQIELS